MTQYMLSVHHDYTKPMPNEEVQQQAFSQVDAFNDEVRAAGVWVFAGGLHPADTATVVRISDDEMLLTDGPYVESKEHLGGFWVIEAADLDEALGWARKGAVACMEPVEVRPFAG